MAPKKATGAAAPKKAATGSTHPPFKDMIKDAIVQLKERSGSSRQAIKKYLRSNYSDLQVMTDATFNQHIARALKNGAASGEFRMEKGASGPVKLGAKKPAAKAATTTKTATKAEKPATTKKVTAATGTKKASTTTTKKATTTKTASKANTAKPRKSAPKKPAPAPAVVPVKAEVKTKTKSGRVSKSTAPTAPKTAAKKATTKKAATTKKPAAKKATPKKAEAAA